MSENNVKWQLLFSIAQGDALKLHVLFKQQLKEKPKEAPTTYFVR